MNSKVAWSIIAAIVILAFLLAAPHIPPGVDWTGPFRPAARALLTGHNPHEVHGFFNPFWTLLPLMPLAILPLEASRALYLLLSLVAFTYAAYRMGAKPLAMGAFLTSPPVLHSLLNANIDWMPVLGFVLPPRLGLFFVLTKPQMGAAVALFWLVQAWRKGGWREALRTFWPVSLALLLSFLLFGFWPANATEPLSEWWNASLWPASIPVGLALLVAAIRRQKMEYAIGAAPCLSPYVLFHAWSGALFSIVALQWETLAAVAGLWILVILRALSLGG